MKTDILIIGAGPIGLYFASLCEKSHKDYLILEATDKVGGQLVNLYPEKDIVDIPGIESIKAKEYIALLETKVDKRKIVLNSQINDVIECDNKVIVKSNSGEFEGNSLVIATGLGFSKPRPLGVNDEDKCSNILYHLKDFSFLKDKKVAIFGGGDSALDWSKAISSLSNDVHLIHRRTEFRGNPETIKNCKNLNVHLPYVPESILYKDGLAKNVTIKEVVNEGEEAKRITIDVDYILVNYGNVPAQSPFKFECDGSFLKVDSNYQIKQRIFAIGDVASYENKKRRIAPGNLEADKVFKLI